MPGSIENFDKLARLFLTHFMANKRRRHPATFLLTIKQREGENLKTYLACLFLTPFMGPIHVHGKASKENSHDSSGIHGLGRQLINAEDTLRALAEPRRKDLE